MWPLVLVTKISPFIRCAELAQWAESLYTSNKPVPFNTDNSDDVLKSGIYFPVA